MSNFTVISDQDAELFRRLKDFYNDICDLTINHEVCDDKAVVYPNNLGAALAKVDENWFVSFKKVDAKI